MVFWKITRRCGWKCDYTGIGYFISKTYNEESKIEHFIEYLDGILNKIRSIVVEEIRKDFMPRNMASLFIESSMTHKNFQCLKNIESHGVLKGVNATSVCREMKKWSKEAEDIDMGWERTDGFTYGVWVKEVKSCSSFMLESYEKRSRSIVTEVSFKLGIDSHVHYDWGG